MLRIKLEWGDSCIFSLKTNNTKQFPEIIYANLSNPGSIKNYKAINHGQPWNKTIALNCFGSLEKHLISSFLHHFFKAVHTIELSAMVELSCIFSVQLATCNYLPLVIWLMCTVASATEELNFKSCFISMNLNSSSHMGLVPTL